MNEISTIAVNTPSRAYEVHVGCGILDHVGSLVRNVASPRSVLLVSDTNVYPLYSERVVSSLSSIGFEVFSHVFEAGEKSKRLSTVEKMLEDMAEASLTRQDCVVALGGGVCGDMAALAASLYLRGVSVVQIPTSLLAMVDSSVGGKSAVDLAHGKNLAGTFLQPCVVAVDPTCLSTLSDELFRDSCGEVIKHAVLADPAMLRRITDRPLTSYHRDDPDDCEALGRIIAENIQIKERVVRADERESGLRQTLNLGHTVGHAIEAASDFTLGHGTCVAIGLCCVSRAGVRLGWCKQSVATDIARAVRAHGLPTDVAMDHDLLMTYAAHDKKRLAGGVNLVVPLRIGEVEVRRVSLDVIKRVIDLGLGTKA